MYLKNLEKALKIPVPVPLIKGERQTWQQKGPKGHQPISSSMALGIMTMEPTCTNSNRESLIIYIYIYLIILYK
jgi:hypothetical protein